jgi:hypothetical protein
VIASTEAQRIENGLPSCVRSALCSSQVTEPASSQHFAISTIQYQTSLMLNLGNAKSYSMFDVLDCFVCSPLRRTETELASRARATGDSMPIERCLADKY